VHTMAEEQMKFQQSTNAKLQQALTHGAQSGQRERKGTATSSSSSRSVPQTPAQPPQREKTERELELEAIGNYLAEDDYENATIKVSIFDTFLLFTANSFHSGFIQNARASCLWRFLFTSLQTTSANFRPLLF
jgi:hypothetical protein